MDWLLAVKKYRPDNAEARLTENLSAVNRRIQNSYTHKAFGKEI
jgi:hypothetical protein